MKTTRTVAITMFEALSQIALGQMEDSVLEKTMTNFEALKRVKDDFEELKKELFKRLYGDVEKMDEEKRKGIQEFFDALSKVKSDEDAVAVKKEYPELFETRVKEMNVIVSLLNKEVEIEIEKVDEKAFVAGVIKGNKKVSVAEAEGLFRPLFEEKEKKEADFSELDELMK